MVLVAFFLFFVLRSFAESDRRFKIVSAAVSIRTLETRHQRRHSKLASFAQWMYSISFHRRPAPERVGVVSKCCKARRITRTARRRGKKNKIRTLLSRDSVLNRGDARSEISYCGARALVSIWRKLDSAADPLYRLFLFVCFADDYCALLCCGQHGAAG